MSLLAVESWQTVARGIATHGIDPQLCGVCCAMLSARSSDMLNKQFIGCSKWLKIRLADKSSGFRADSVRSLRYSPVYIDIFQPGPDHYPYLRYYNYLDLTSSI